MHVSVRTDVAGGAAPPDAAPAILVSGLQKRFGSFTAVAGLDFAVRRGEIFGLLGPNGSGKTTTINLISGLSEPTAGRILVLGLDPRRHADAVRRQLGVVPQETALYEELTARRNLAFHAELFGIPARERPARIAAMLRLAQLEGRAGSRVGTFSGGMKRRLAIARALLHDPALLYLDEPTLGVDVQARRYIWDYILATKAEGRTVLLTTNYLEEANVLCDRLAIIDRGRLVALDTPANLRARYGASVAEVELTGPAPEPLLRALEGIPGVRGLETEGAGGAEGPGTGGRIRISLGAGGIGAGGDLAATGVAADSGGSLLPAILSAIAVAGLGVRHLSLREPALDEAFLALTGRGLRD